MGEKPLTPLEKIQRFLLIALDQNALDGERMSAIRAIERCLPSAGLDKHALAERIEKEPLDQEEIKEEMKRVYHEGYAARMAEEAALRRNLAAVIPHSGGRGVNGYSWREIANYCLLNKHRIRNSWERDTFIESVAGQLNSRGFAEPSEKQKPILQRIFQQWFNGEIK